MPVSPVAKQFFCASSNASFARASSGPGTLAETRSTALSTSIPVSLPLFTSISPPSSLSPGLIPAVSSALLLAMAACPSILFKSTGRSGNNSFSFSLDGKSFTAQSFWSQPLPVSHMPGGRFFAKSWQRFNTSSQLPVPTRSTVCRLNPYPTKCACASIKPGNIVFPLASSTRSDSYCFSISSFFPTSTILPSRIAMASATENLSSTV